ncbi:MAG: NAD-dependent deacylase [bacterium]|nr:NAD-dependent deacylase [bacterium]
MCDNFSQQVEQAADWIRSAERLSAMTGAGVSAESGVPTFRGAGGLWEGRRAEEMATPEAFRADPACVWRFYNMRRDRLLQCAPNAAHQALAEIEKDRTDFCLITQNVDGLHRAAGSRNVVELHGDIWIDRCGVCDYAERVTEVSQAPIPRCPKCDGMMRPGVVWFGETLPPDAIDAAQTAAAQCAVMLVIGTSSMVQPAASLAMVAQHHGAKVIEINPESTPLTADANLVIAEKAGTAMAAIAKALSQPE